MWMLFAFKPSPPFSFFLSFSQSVCFHSNLISPLFFSSPPFLLLQLWAYMKAEQPAGPIYAVGHACLSWMPLNGQREEQQTVLLWATQSSSGMVTWVTGYICLCICHKCFQVHLEMPITTLADQSSLGLRLQYGHSLRPLLILLKLNFRFQSRSYSRKKEYLLESCG